MADMLKKRAMDRTERKHQYIDHRVVTAEYPFLFQYASLVKS